jgi:hypothetical protein
VTPEDEDDGEDELMDSDDELDEEAIAGGEAVSFRRGERTLTFQAVTPAAKRRQEQTAARKAAALQRKAHIQDISQKRSAMEKAKVSRATHNKTDWIACRLDEALQLPPWPDGALPALRGPQGELIGMCPS